VLVQAALTLVVASSALQIAALRNGLEGLAWPIGPQHKRAGYLLAGVLLVLALGGGLFLVRESVTLPSLFTPALFLVGSGLALAVHVVGAAVRLSWNRGRRRTTASRGRPIALGPVQAIFYQPAGRGPFPALCLLPDPTAPADNLTNLAQALVESNIAVLVLDWRSLDNPDRLMLQGLVAVGISHLTRWPETDAGRVGLAGVGLGGDLALRGAAADAGVAVALALEPVLANRRPGLGLAALRDLSWFEAHKRARAWRRSALVKALDALTAIRAIGKRPTAIVTGLAGETRTIDNLEILRTEEGCPLVSAAHAEMVGCVVAWLKERLS
jgi:hypothetical protein